MKPEIRQIPMASGLAECFAWQLQTMHKMAIRYSFQTTMGFPGRLFGDAELQLSGIPAVAQSMVYVFVNQNCGQDKSAS